MVPLTGIKVLDLSRLLPGPYASLVLGDLGAQVDKIEDVIGGDYLRHMPPQVGDQSGIFLAINRNKRSASLDLKKPAGKKALLALVKKYDVVIDQFRPRVLDRLGLSHAKMREANPRLVVCALTGYGQEGPLSQRAGHDLNYLARAGILGFQGPPGGPPALPGFQIADIGGALWSVIGILAALAERARTGEGGIVDISMMEAAMGFAAISFGMMTGGETPRRGDEALTGAIAPYGTYATNDERAVTLGALEPKFWTAFCLGVGMEAEMSALLPGPHQIALKKRVADIFRSRTLAEWVAFGAEVDCCLEPVLLANEIVNDAHVVARQLFFDLPSPWGNLLQMRLPITPRDMTHRPPPKQGEHTDEILREAGLSDEEIAEMRADGSAR